ncbi:MAG TPA: hypothetical protein VGH87_10530 [Polyangiaceae bacterium]
MNLDWLKAVDSDVELGPTGEAAVETPAFQAYAALLADLDALRAHEDELVEIVRSSDSKPAAIIYAAYLLQALDRADLRDLLARWDDDRRECTIWPGGCCGSTHWLCEATRFVLGEMWNHPVRLLAISIEQIERAKWLELPGDETMRAIREGRRPDYRAHAIWVFRFAELHESTNLLLAREMLEAIRPLAARVYAAMLVRRIDRAAGDTMLDRLASKDGSIDILERGSFGKRTRSVPLREAVALALEWSARAN